MKWIKYIIIPFLWFNNVSCQSDNTTTGNPFVAIEFASFSASNFKPLAVSSVTMCFKRLRFKTENESTNSDPILDDDNIDFEIDEVTLSNGGTSLGTVQVPPGTYTRIEFDLEDKCSSGSSVSVTNSSGTFMVNDRITIKFEGNVIIEKNTTLSMAVQAIVVALDSITADSEIKTQMEGVSGSF